MISFLFAYYIHIGQKIKLVIAACLWNIPQVRCVDLCKFLIELNLFFFQICVLDEPSNFLDREALGGLAVAIQNWSGAVVRLLSSNIAYDSKYPSV